MPTKEEWKIFPWKTVLVGMLMLLIGTFSLVRIASSDEPCGKCPSCPSAKTIAEQVVEDIASQPRPQVVKCTKHKIARGGGFIARCLVLFPTAGAPPLARVD